MALERKTNTPPVAQLANEIAQMPKLSITDKERKAVIEAWVAIKERHKDLTSADKTAVRKALTDPETKNAFIDQLCKLYDDNPKWKKANIEKCIYYFEQVVNLQMMLMQFEELAVTSLYEDLQQLKALEGKKKFVIEDDIGADEVIGMTSELFSPSDAPTLETLLCALDSSTIKNAIIALEEAQQFECGFDENNSIANAATQGLDRVYGLLCNELANREDASLRHTSDTIEITLDLIAAAKQRIQELKETAEEPQSKNKQAIKALNEAKRIAQENDDYDEKAWLASEEYLTLKKAVAETTQEYGKYKKEIKLAQEEMKALVAQYCAKSFSDKHSSFLTNISSYTEIKRLKALCTEYRSHVMKKILENKELKAELKNLFPDEKPHYQMALMVYTNQGVGKSKKMDTYFARAKIIEAMESILNDDSKTNTEKLEDFQQVFQTEKDLFESTELSKARKLTGTKPAKDKFVESVSSSSIFKAPTQQAPSPKSKPQAAGRFFQSEAKASLSDNDSAEYDHKPPRADKQ